MCQVAIDRGKLCAAHLAHKRIYKSTRDRGNAIPASKTDTTLGSETSDAASAKITGASVW